MTSSKRIIFILLSLFIISGNAYAKDLGGMLGIGYNSQLSAQEINSISAKYWIDDHMGVQGIFGFISGDDYDELNIGGKFLYKIKDEDNLHLDAFGALGLTDHDPDDADGYTGITLGGGMAMEFFLSGLPNLGFSTEIGFIFTDKDDTSAFGTTSDTFITAGIHYYFNLSGSSKSSTTKTKVEEKPL